MDSSWKDRAFSLCRLGLIIIVAAILLAECLYLFCVVAGYYLDLKWSTDKASLVLSFVILICLAALGYLLYSVYFINQHYVALGCSSKMTVEEYEKMKKETTQRELSKLKNSKEFKEYLRKSQQMRNVSREHESLEDIMPPSSESEAKEMEFS